MKSIKNARDYGMLMMIETQVSGGRLKANGEQFLSERLRVRDERGDVTPRTVGIAVMTALAVAVGIIITGKVMSKANSIELD